MAELLWKNETEIHSWDVFNQIIINRKPETIRTKRTLWKSDKAVWLANSSYIGGLNKNGAAYYRWIPVFNLGVRHNHKGTLIPFCVHLSVSTATGPRRVQKWSSGLAYIYLFSTRYNNSTYFQEINEFRKTVREVYGIEKFTDLFPIAGMTGIDFVNSWNPFDSWNPLDVIPPNILHAMRNENFADFVREVFGKSRYRKDLTKATANLVENGNLNLIAFLKEFRGLAPIDWIIRTMRERPNMLHDYCRIPKGNNFRLYLKAVNPRSYRFLLREEIPEYVLYNMTVNREGNYHEVLRRGIDRDRVFRSWEEFHEIIAPQYRQARGVGRTLEVAPPPRNIAFDFKGLRVDLHDVDVNDYHFEVALCSQQMRLWSDKMRNCISSYIGDADHDIFGAIFNQDGTLIANYQLTSQVHNSRNWRVVQLFGPCNQNTSVELQEIFEQLMEKHGVNCSRYYGKR